jgi:DUF1009 family protein
VAPKLGILAGTGDLPLRLIDACRSQGRETFVITFQGENRNTDLSDAPGACVHLGKVGTVYSLLRKSGCKDVIMAGRFRRPAYNELKLDLQAAKLVPKLLRASGDDALLRVLSDALEGQGFNVIGVDSLLPSLQIADGALGSVSPEQADLTDIGVGIDLLRTLGRFDIGQAAVVGGGRVLAIEGPEGTDAMIDRCADLDHGGGGVLIKMRKPGQDERVDLPSIGPETVRRAARARLSGIAVEAHATLVVDRQEVVLEADRHGIFVYGFVSDGQT